MANLNILLSIVSDILDRITLKISQSTLSSNKLMGYALILFIKVLTFSFSISKVESSSVTFLAKKQSKTRSRLRLRPQTEHY